MSNQPVILTVAEGVAEIRLNRPKVLNAISRDMMKMMRESVAEIARRDDVSVCTITGEGRGFCSGADLTDPMMGVSLPRHERSAHCVKVMDGEINAMMRDLAELRVPKIAVVNGIAAGGGAGLALVADIVIAARSASFVIPFVPKLGIVPDLGSTWHLARGVGRARAIGLSMLGEALPAEKAAEWGLIWKCVDDEKLQEEAGAIITKLRDGPTLAQAALATIIDKAFLHTYSDQLDAERDVQAVLIESEDTEEAIVAFREKRAPRFKGR